MKYALQVRGDLSENVGIFFCGTLHSHVGAAFNKFVEIFAERFVSSEVMVVPQNTENVKMDGLRELISRGVTKLLWIHSHSPNIEFYNFKDCFPLFERLERLVIYNFVFSDDDWEKKLLKKKIHLVGVDRASCSRCIAKMLKKLGHENICVLGFPYGPYTEANYENIDPFRALGLKTYGAGKPYHTFKPRESGMEVAKVLMKAKKEFGVSAAFIRQDDIAGYVIHFLENAGFSVPGDMTIIGFDDMSFAEALRVPLTTCRVPMNEMMDKSIEILEGKKSSSSRNVFEIELIKRKSHGTVKASNKQE
jgi:DNA-binding LacI/PurR family transcriptional regulator